MERIQIINNDCFLPVINECLLHKTVKTQLYWYTNTILNNFQKTGTTCIANKDTHYIVRNYRIEMRTGIRVTSKRKETVSVKFMYI